jgi:phosphomannomutase/phosphoglucomutase
MIDQKAMFRAYDIRGIFNEDLTNEITEKIGKSFGTFIGEGKKVSISRDGRLSGITLRDRITSGLISVGCDVIDIGMTPTPVLYFSVANKKLDGGVMITASHNPPEWNGFKLVKEMAAPCSEGTGLERVKENVFKNKFNKPVSKGEVKKYEKIFDDYFGYVLKKIKIGRKLKVVMDTGNGATGLTAPKLFKKLGFDIIVLNEKVDGNFPVHPPEPKEEYLQQLRKEVVNANADFGVAYDGDGDRAVFVDEKGNIITSGSVIIMVIAKSYLEKQKNSKIVFDVCCSKAVEELIRNNGGIPLITKVGYVHIKNKMTEENAVFGGEYSNHLYFSEIYCADDGVFASLKIAEILSNTNKRFSEIVDSVPRYPAIFDWNFDCPDEIKFNIIEKLKNKFKKQGMKTLELDGVKLFFDDGWILWRASNTQPQIKVYLEANKEERLNELRKFAEEELKNIMNGD